MIKCCICGNGIKSAEPAVLFIGLDGNEKEICTDCKQKMDIMTISDKLPEIKTAINCLYNYLPTVGDTEVVSFLEDAIKANGEAVVELEKTDRKNRQQPPKRDYFSDYESDGNNGQAKENQKWIKYLKNTAWIFFAALIVTGIISGIGCAIYGDISLGFAIISASAVVAVFFLAFIMVIANMAQDIADIKKNEKDKKQ